MMQDQRCDGERCMICVVRRTEFGLEEAKLSQRQMRRAEDQTAHALSHNMPFIAGKIGLLCEDQNRAGFEDSGFNCSDDKGCSELSFRLEGISSVNGFCYDKSSPSLQVFSIGRVVISACISSLNLVWYGSVGASVS